MVSQSDTKWSQNVIPNGLKIHPLGRCQPKGDPNVTFWCLGVPPLIQKRPFLDAFLHFLQPLLRKIPWVLLAYITKDIQDLSKKNGLEHIT